MRSVIGIAILSLATTLATANTQPVRSPASTPSDSKSSVSDGDLNKFVQNEFKLFQKFE